MRYFTTLSVFILTSCASISGSHKFTRIEKVYYTDKNEDRLSGEILIPNVKNAPGVILVHGGGWRSRSYSDMNAVAESLASSGYTVFNINYRLSPKHKHPAPIEDLNKALIYFKDNAEKYNLDKKRIGLWGYSSGGHTVSYYALKNSGSNHSVQAVVTGGAPYDFTWYPLSPYIKDYLGFYRDKDLVAYEKASVTNHIDKNAPPFFLYHAINDKLVEFAQTTSFQAKLMKNGTKVQRHDIDYWGHSFAFIFSKETIEEAISFLDKELK